MRSRDADGLDPRQLDPTPMLECHRGLRLNKNATAQIGPRKRHLNFSLGIEGWQRAYRFCVLENGRTTMCPAALSLMRLTIKNDCPFGRFAFAPSP